MSLKEMLAQYSYSTDTKTKSTTKDIPSEFFVPDQQKKYQIRFLPTKLGSPTLRERSIHYKVGLAKPFLCPERNFSEKCPVCAFGRAMFHEGKETNNRELQKTAKAMIPANRFYRPLLVRGEEDKGARWWGHSEKICKELESLFQDDDYKEAMSVMEGVDFDLEYFKTEGKAFPDIVLKPKRKSSKLAETEEEVVKILESIPDIDKQFVKVSTEEVRTILESFLLKDSSSDGLKDDVEKYGQESKEQTASTAVTEDNIDKLFNSLEEEK